MSDLRARIKETIEQEPVVAFVKGTHEQAYCGNSDRAMQALWSVGAGFTTVDVLPDPSTGQEPRRPRTGPRSRRSSWRASSSAARTSSRSSR